MKTPKIGSKIYVRSACYIGHGEDDFVGGVATVQKVESLISAGKPTPFVTVKERPGSSYNWEILEKEQAELKKEFGKRKAYADPDTRPEFNDDRW